MADLDCRYSRKLSPKIYCYWMGIKADSDSDSDSEGEFECEEDEEAEN